LVLPRRDATDDELGVLIVDGAATLTDMAWQGVARGDVQGHGGTALATESHGLDLATALFQIKIKTFLF
jgi:hypothetical protein